MKSFKAGDWLVQEWKDGDVDIMQATKDGNFTDVIIHCQHRSRIKANGKFMDCFSSKSTEATLTDSRIKDFRLALPHEIPEQFRTPITEQNNNYSIF